MIATLVLFGLMIVATFTDLWKHQIYNWTTYSGIIAALVLSAAAGMANGSDENDASHWANIGIQESLMGLVVCGAIMLTCFVLFQIGGGDVKLITMTGAFVGPAIGIEILLWTFVLGGLSAVLILIWKCGAVELVQSLLQQVLGKLQFGQWQPLTEQQQARLKSRLYLAPCALVALLIVHFFPVTQSLAT